MKPIFGLALVFVAHSAAAQEADWRYKATFYGWFPGLSASVLHGTTVARGVEK